MKQILQTAHELLKQRGLAVGGYARIGNSPVGLHTPNAQLDLAAALWLAVNDDEITFHRVWQSVREFCGWLHYGPGRTNPDFCKYLDKKNIEWHLNLLTAMLTGGGVPSKRASRAEYDLSEYTF